MCEKEAQNQFLQSPLAFEAEAWGMEWRGRPCTPRKGKRRGRECWAAAAAADLGRGGHADLGDKRVVKQAEDLLLLDLLGRGVFGRRRHWWAFPKLWVGSR